MLTKTKIIQFNPDYIICSTADDHIGVGNQLIFSKEQFLDIHEEEEDETPGEFDPGCTWIMAKTTEGDEKFWYFDIVFIKDGKVYQHFNEDETTFFEPYNYAGN